MSKNDCNSSVALHQETFGKGNPIVFLHGFGASTYSWRHLIDPFKEQHQLIMIDLKGFGLSPKPSDKCYSTEDQANLIYQLILERDLKNLTLVGHSYGGGVALFTAIKLIEAGSDRLSSLILFDSVAYKQSLPTFINLLRTPLIAPIGLCLLPSKFHTHSILKLAYYDDHKISKEQVAAYARPIDTPGGRQALIKIAEQVVPQNIEEISSRYQKIKVPTLIVWGKQDEIVPLRVGELLHKSITSSKFIVLDKCGHIPHEEKPNETIDIMSNFLKDNTIR